MGEKPTIKSSTDSLFGLLKTNRGWTDQYLREINEPSYDELLDMPAMVEALHKIRTEGRKLVVLPDFDMDGITSGVLGYAGFSELGFNVDLYTPDFRRGHDISAEAVHELHGQFPDVEAIITCDGGVNSHAGIKAGKQLGLTMLITDHHVQLDKESPADVIVDPERIDETYAHPGICGAFVLYQVLMAYAQKHAPHKVGDISMLKLFAGVGTVSDVMPLFYENRQVVRDSLSLARLLYVTIPVEDTVTEYDIEKSILMSLLRAQEHHPVYVSVFEGFALMMKVFRETGKLRGIRDLKEDFYGFYLAPAFNSIRRINGSMDHAFKVFTEPDPAEKTKHMNIIIGYNELRKELTETYMEDLLEAEQPLAPYVYLTDAPTGMLGLIAAKLMHLSNMPVAVVRKPDDDDKRFGGSARSPFWFPIITTMTAAGFGAVGHENACGVSAKGLAGIQAFAEHMGNEAESMHAAMLLDGTFAEANMSDLVLGARDFCDGGYDDLEELKELTQSIDNQAPFGHAFPRPLFELVLDLSQCSIGTLGKKKPVEGEGEVDELDQPDQHLKIILRSGLKLLWWGQAELYNDLVERAESPMPGDSTLRLKVDLSMNFFRGNESVQGIVKDRIEDPDQDQL